MNKFYDKPIYVILATLLYIFYPILGIIASFFANIFNIDISSYFLQLTIFFDLNAISQLLAGSLLAWWAYIFRYFIIKFFSRRTYIIRSPITTAVAPLYISQKERMFDMRNLSINVEYRGVGIKALKDLVNKECDFAICSDTAIASFLEINKIMDIAILPFTKSTNALKIITKDLKYKSVDECIKQSNLIGYLDNSIALDVISQYKISKQTLKPYSSFWEAFFHLVDGNIDSFICWEPYYRAYEKIPGIKVFAANIDKNHSYFLCLVGSRKTLTENNELAMQIYNIFSEACRKSEDERDYISSVCSEYMHEEFTGIDKIDTKLLIQNHSYHLHKGFKDFNHRLNEIPYVVGAAKIRVLLEQSQLWPNINMDFSDKEL
ncbi:hypothetical protein QUF74_15645 [Candidatus Halobeggiatoa sp. HSG11]|nr:hypothetical protein [Candidatus Halobeggiatoa sp. HSG11]